MTPDELTRLKELDESAYRKPLKVRTGFMAGDRVTVDITTEDYAYPPFVRLWSHPLMDYEQIPPQEGVVKKLVGAYNALPGLLAEIDRLTNRLSIAEARLGRVSTNHPDAYLAALEGERTP